MSGFTRLPQFGQTALLSGMRASAITRASGSIDGSTGICTNPPPSARRRLLLPRELRVRVLPVALVAGPVPGVVAVAPAGAGRRAPVSRPVVRPYPPCRAVCTPLAGVAVLGTLVMTLTAGSARPQVSQKPPSNWPGQLGSVQARAMGSSPSLLLPLPCFAGESRGEGRSAPRSVLWQA